GTEKWWARPRRPVWWPPRPITDHTVNSTRRMTRFARGARTTNTPWRDPVGRCMVTGKMNGTAIRPRFARTSSTCWSRAISVVFGRRNAVKTIFSHAVVALALCASACSKEQPQVPEKQLTPDEQQVVGEWHLTKPSDGRGNVFRT